MNIKTFLLLILSTVSDTNFENKTVAVENNQVAVETTTEITEEIQSVAASDLSRTERSIRDAAVKVERYYGSGYGSGTLMRIDGELVVSTAAHVTGDQPIMIIHGRDGESVPGRVIYCDAGLDIAFVHVEEMNSRDPVRFRPIRERRDPVGMEITYTGFPNRNDLLTINGTIAGTLFDETLLLMQSYAWMGASGSGVFNDSGEFVGSLIAVEVGSYFDRQIIETMVYVTSARNINENVLRNRLRESIAPVNSTLSGLPDYSCQSR